MARLGLLLCAAAVCVCLSACAASQTVNLTFSPKRRRCCCLKTQKGLEAGVWSGLCGRR